MATRILTCAEAKKVDLVDYMTSLGYVPKKISNQDYWYLSPFRDERTASFKVNRKQGVWYDHGAGIGGDIIDFGTLFYNCSVSDFLRRLTAQLKQSSFSFHPPMQTSKAVFRPAVRDTFSAGEKKENWEGKIVIIGDGPIVSQQLIAYLETRCIPLKIADQLCREVDFVLYGKNHSAIGFGNKAGGYELRSENFKGSSSPKDFTLISNNHDQVAVFEGFFSFLSYLAINQKQQTMTNFLVLNSLSFFQKARDKMEDHHQVHLYLDRDASGIKHTLQALEWDKNKYIDKSGSYDTYRDLNEWLTHNRHNLRQSLRPGRQL